MATGRDNNSEEGLLQHQLCNSINYLQYELIQFYQRYAQTPTQHLGVIIKRA